MPSYLDTLIENRQRTWHQGKALLDAAAAENRNLTAAEEETYQRINDDLDGLEQRIAGQKDADARNADAGAAFSRLGLGSGRRSSNPSAVERLLRGEIRTLDVDLGIHQRDLVKGTASAGGNVVPTSFESQLQRHLVASSAIRQTNAQVFRTDSGEDMQVPKTATHSTATLTAEGVALTESDPTFAQATMKSWKYGLLLQVTNELIADSGVDLEGYLAQQAGEALGNLSGGHFVTGDNTGKPQGVIPGATTGVTGAGGVAGAFTADNLIDLMFSVLPQHRAKGYWLMSDTALAAVRKLKASGTGEYLFQPALVAGTPDTLLGRPVVTDPNVAVPASDAKSVAFGNFEAYAIRDVRAVRFEASEHYAFNQDVVTYRAILRTDGRWIGDASAIKVFVGGAAV
jgi:HK97 family phage major capsid protein